MRYLIPLLALVACSTPAPAADCPSRPVAPYLLRSPGSAPLTPAWWLCAAPSACEPVDAALVRLAPSGACHGYEVALDAYSPGVCPVRAPVYCVALGDAGMDLTTS